MTKWWGSYEHDSQGSGRVEDRMIKLATLGISALLAIIILTSQYAYANWIGGFNCFGEPRCVSGWNHAIIQAQTDWNSGQYTKIPNGGNPECFVEHTQAYCNGYAEGYAYEWNTLYQGQQTPTGPSLDTLYNKGLALYHLGNYTEAIGYFDKVLAVNPKYIAALGGKGNVLLALGNYTGAILYYDRVLAINPSDRHALNNKGNALLALGNYTGAILHYDKALTVDPSDENALNNKGA
ncbi:MAG: tetratricopeptide repeat protein, partial [Candidatus Nitrosopolaris sp.]